MVYDLDRGAPGLGPPVRAPSPAPHRTNDIDTDQRRRTLDGIPDPDPLTPGAIEGSHERMFVEADP
jgi:hypothetical protein